MLSVPPEHPEAEDLASRVPIVERLVRAADVVRTSTEPLAARMAGMAARVRVVENALDERIWRRECRAREDDYGPVRILCMGTATHDADFEVVRPALEDIHRLFGDQIRIDLVGFVSSVVPPDWIRRLAPSRHASRSYPGFVHWLHGAGPWDIGLAPLADTPFNGCKSAIKVMDYTALGLAVLASDVPAYRGVPGGETVENTTAAWGEALSLMIRDRVARRRLAARGGEWLRASGTLAARSEVWREGWTGGR
jgi:hypothetical protein